MTHSALLIITLYQMSLFHSLPWQFFPCFFFFFLCLKKAGNKRVMSACYLCIPNRIVGRSLRKYRLRLFRTACACSASLSLSLSLSPLSRFISNIRISATSNSSSNTIIIHRIMTHFIHIIVINVLTSSRPAGQMSPV